MSSILWLISHVKVEPFTLPFVFLFHRTILHCQEELQSTLDATTVTPSSLLLFGSQNLEATLIIIGGGEGGEDGEGEEKVEVEAGDIEFLIICFSY